MTGYGLFSSKYEGSILEFEVKSINSKFLDLNIKSNLDSNIPEKEIRKLVKDKIERGKVEVGINLLNSKNDQNKIDKKEFNKLFKQIKGMVDSIKISDETILNNTFLIYEKKQNVPNIKISKKNILDNVMNAVKKCMNSRFDEGKSIKKDLLKNINEISKSLNFIKKLDKKRAIEKRKKIESQLNKLKSLKIDELRLEQEIFYFLDKIDINEEITRLTKHISLFKKTLKERGPHGKKINFISQELGREINTIGAKCNDFDIQSNTIKMKTNLEKIKEESFNIL
tara:strand:+ start:2147 stop:2995 length:849 start_codon:yes stop_codon:yes gene_type:complete